MKIQIADENDKQAVFALRLEVFVDEQNVPPEIEIDEEDADAIHIIAYRNGVAVGCGRIVFDENSAHIGRIAVKKEYRNTGVGSAVCRFIVDYCTKKGMEYIWLNSQLQAVRFYEKLGFKKKGDVFTEAGIPHIQMEI